jgi:FAD/FMN-containing dehydrogenase
MTAAGLFAERLQGVVGATHVALDGEAVTVQPGAAAEVTDVLRVARELGASAGVGRAPIGIDLGRMRNVLHLDETSLLVVVQAGLGVGELEELLSERGLTLGPLPPTSRARTVGAMLAAPRPSEASPRMGRFSAACAGIAAVLPDGTELQTRVAPRKATGPDLMHALVGTRGTLGIITAATLRIARRGEARQEAAWALPSLEDAVACARALLVRGGRPADLAVAAAPAPTLSVAVDGPQAVAESERALAHRLVAEHGGRPVPHTPPPLMTAPPHETPLALDAMSRWKAPASASARSLRLLGWHTAGATVIDPERAPAPPAAPHPLVLALKTRLDPDGRLPAWPGI